MAKGTKKEAHAPPCRKIRYPADLRALNRGRIWVPWPNPRAGCNPNLIKGKGQSK